MDLQEVGGGRGLAQDRDSWLRIGTGGGHLWVRRGGTFGFHKCVEFLD